jgi:haloalkane dehalogenase
MNDWIDHKEYPFKSNFFDLQMGRLHYVDEGKSDHAIVMVHGNPVWSFVYRKFIKHFSKNYRCIAPDHIGFGLSDKPSGWDYLPEIHAENLKSLLDHLNCKSITLIVGDWGGPIGLSYALYKPDKVKALVIMNTWMWSVKGDLHFEGFSRLMGGIIGRFLIKRFNFFVKVLMKRMFQADIPYSLHQHYIKPLEKPSERKGCWIFPKRIIGSTNWLDELWSKKDEIKNISSLILWGKKDIAFREKELRKWMTFLNDAETHKFENIGHFVPEELKESDYPIIDEFLKKKLA